MEDRSTEAAADALLKGWREIAGYFGCDISTVRRWAAEKSLPVYRVGGSGGRGGSVHAFASELEAWLRSDKGHATQASDAARRAR